MKELRITVRCQLQPKLHAKVIRVKARLGKRRAQELADLLDGSSLAYVHPPGANSPIGRCCQCQAEVNAEVSEIVDGNEVPPSSEEVIAIDQHKKSKAERKLGAVLGLPKKGA